MYGSPSSGDDHQKLTSSQTPTFRHTTHPSKSLRPRPRQAHLQRTCLHIARPAASFPCLRSHTAEATRRPALRHRRCRNMGSTPRNTLRRLSKPLSRPRHRSINNSKSDTGISRMPLRRLRRRAPFQSLRKPTTCSRPVFRLSKGKEMTMGTATARLPCRLPFE